MGSEYNLGHIYDIIIVVITIILGHGRVITSTHGTLECLHSEVVKANSTSVWLFIFPRGYKMRLNFENVNIPVAKFTPKLLVRKGLRGMKANFL